eukprot:6258764-Pyramimonas_sp.AAC.1
MTARANATSLGSKWSRRAVARPASRSTWRAPPVALATSKRMLQTGGGPRLWLREWMREKGVARTDRVAHEMRTVV